MKTPMIKLRTGETVRLIEALILIAAFHAPLNRRNGSMVN